jgi:superfamily II DNA/RNA helicase
MCFSGKTLAFVVPMINKIIKCCTTLKENRILGVIISPTQELALQTDAVVKQFSSQIPHISTCVFVGGNDIIIYLILQKLGIFAV